MKDLFLAARRLQRFFDRQGWRSCIIGGLAVQRWGEPRFTRDVDVTLLTGLGHEEKYVDAILRRYAPRIDGAREFALQHRVMLLQDRNATGIDVALGGIPFEERVIERSSAFEFYPGIVLRTCSAEDLIVMKAFAGRELDWGDVRSIIARQSDGLNWRQIRSELRPLCELKGAPEILTHLEKMRREIQR
ncbi:MAG: nucleotidyl transferase AbiEii/AbiGii toxin family protein [Verrucomicrobiae bacterium]|nr:nucleotidyl transferase AbiEii/AbiGii toxin family protein [Verrucomicrobiae bacterium]MDW8307796.1 nucleotidyl transferase AbiEii/AbiGii toxin family protein [Verrucomicrobiales bacterium]